ncbi:hypothetical protein [Desulfovibrio gilichinskyi]|uniref:DUF3592 domain-containing protein n=1 Tax=Desulfovibrio gilichinskyi TaxID=1519643 RepID=A0A1X7D1Q8_9BACT|nr:hypothetical protein [Desulfovibrio gilichinskyi]SMF06560.1 hypothetical protein SAMN06295933_1503 [Desulfovibrio gilichinskyi]
MSIFYIPNYSPVKKNLLIVGAFLFLCALYAIPYQEIRIERIRAFGESETVGTVIEKISVNHHELQSSADPKVEHFIRYQFIDPLGQTQEKIAGIPDRQWQALSGGDSIIVYYAKAAPRISRVKNEKESNVIKLLSKISRPLHESN